MYKHISGYSPPQQREKSDWKHHGRVVDGVEIGCSGVEINCCGSKEEGLAGVEWFRNLGKGLAEIEEIKHHKGV